MQKWIKAARLRTLPLSLASIIMGNCLAAFFGSFSYPIFLWTVLTTICLQILSNYANDYGDAVNGADLAGRIGPARAVQSGEITKNDMLNAVVVMVGLSLLCGIYLLYVSFGGFQNQYFYGFLVLGLLSILAAYFYTAGAKPYGYAGLGDLSVFIFFGLIGVLGSMFLQTKTLIPAAILPAISTGLFAVNVLNINNLRDIESDQRAGKQTIPVRLGKRQGVVYHKLVMLMAWTCALIFTVLNFQKFWQFGFLLLLPLFYRIFTGIQYQSEPKYIDGFLKKMAISSLLFSILFGGALLLLNF